MKTTLDELKENKNVLYIYNVGDVVYGLNDDNFYVIIVQTDYFDEAFELFEENDPINLYSIKEWFDIVQNGELIGWICACLPKKFVIKEYVKLLMTTDAVTIYNQNHMFENMILEDNDIVTAKHIIKSLVLSAQIIENHKIVNFKKVFEDIKLPEKFTNEKFHKLIQPMYDLVMKYTKPLYLAQIKKKIYEADQT